MDGQYPPSSTSPTGTFYPAGYPQMMPPEMAQSRPHPTQSMSMESLSSYPDPENASRTMQASSSTQPQARPPRRRREPPGADHVKHKRTRSGCFTCRQRRVKCDEARPVCDRCRKGNRDCTYPGNAPTASASSSKKGKSKGSPSGSSPPASDPETEEREPLSAVPDDDDDDKDDGDDNDDDDDNDNDDNDDAIDDENDADSSSAMSASRKLSTASGIAFDDIASHLTDRSSTSRRGSLRPQSSRTASRQTIPSPLTQTTSWSTLPNDVKFYLKFHRENLSYHHYAFRCDGNDFLHTTFLRTAINEQSAALLYAIVAFAAYHHSLTRDNDKISTFLSYYNQSIGHLQQALVDRRHTVATLLTTLQLATIEEFLGDWVNLLGHQKAAHQLLTSLFTPRTIMQDETSRKILTWYIRFDVFAGVLSGDAPSLSRDWYLASVAYYQQQARDNPSDLGAQFEEQTSASQLLAADLALLFAAKAKNTISDEQFTSDARTLAGRLAAFGNRIENAFTDPACFAQSFASAPPLSANDIVDFREPNFFYTGAFSTMNFVLMAFWAIDLTFKFKLAVIQNQPPPPELAAIALKKCKMIEAIQYCNDGPPGALLACQSSLTLAALFLPQDAKHTTWCRRKFVLIEQSGYILPQTLRARVSAQWGIDVSRWWLPNDEGYPTIVRTLRDFIEYRAALPPDDWQAGVTNMRGIFESMQLSSGGRGGGEDQSSPEELRRSYTDSEMFPSP